MQHVDNYRDAQTCHRLLDEIRSIAARPYTLMEVCGGQTHGLLGHGIDQALSGCVELIHGPGCPVCVTPVADIDLSIKLSLLPDVTVVTFGDMLRVPGSHQSLREAAASGANVRLVYSPLDAVQLARENPQQHYVFFAVGFETTTPATAVAILQAERLGLENFSMLVSHVRVQPAMSVIMNQEDCFVEGFLAAGHVCAVGGYRAYHRFVKQHRVPVVVTGFEPVDLLAGILASVRQLRNGTAEVENLYSRTVTESGNQEAQQLVDRVYEVSDRPWRGMGMIAEGGYQLHDEFARWDSRKRFGFAVEPLATDSECPSGQILTGRLKPRDCPFFGNRCTPLHPLGAPMVSSEGACAAYYKVHPVTAMPTLESQQDNQHP